MRENYAEPCIVGVWREGVRFVMLQGAALPRFCVKCGRPVPGPTVRKTYYWAPASFFRFIPFPGSLIAVIIALIVRKKITVDISICAVHRRRRVIGLLLTWIFCGSGVMAIGIGLNWAISPIGSDADNAPTMIAAGIFLLLIGAGCFVFAGRLLSPKQIDEDKAVFSGAGARFLSLLPASPNVGA